MDTDVLDVSQKSERNCDATILPDFFYFIFLYLPWFVNPYNKDQKNSFIL